MEKKNRNEMVEDVMQNTHDLLAVAISDDYLGDIIRELSADIIADVETSSAFLDEGYWNNDDIKLAIGRTLVTRLGIER